MQEQGKDVDVLKDVINALIRGEKLPQCCRDHSLQGRWKSHRDCHIKPDWVLIYRIEGDALFLERTGSHSDLFS